MIYLGSDHGGFDLKEKIKRWLNDWGYRCEDMGNTIYNQEDDYPRYAFVVAKKVADEEKKGLRYPAPWKDRPKGILCCRSAAGMVIAANKVRGARATAVFDVDYSKKTRLHNDSNILAIGADFLEELKIKKIIKAWLETEFTGEDRHIRRIGQISDYEVLGDEILSK